MSVLLRLANIEKTYNITKTQKQDVLKGVDAEFDRGEFVALVGESGCGKSTLINILGGLDTEYTGSVVVKDQFIRDYTEQQMDDYRKKRVGMVFQTYNLITHLTLAENIEIAMRMSDISYKVRHERALDLLNMVGLKEYADKYPTQLSGGQQQRVSIARALANNPSIILADEPTGALDKESEEVILKILKKVVESGKLVIVVTHSELVASHCSRVVRIADGVVVEDNIKYQVKKSGKFEKTIMPKPIKTKDVAKISMNNIKQKKSRSLIVSIGLSLGIAAMVLILNLGKGLTDYVQEVYADNLQTTQIAITKDNYANFTYDELEEIATIEGIETMYESSTILSAEYTYGETTDDVYHLSAFYDDYYPSILYGSYPEADGEILINETFATTLSDGAMIAVIGTTVDITYDSTTYTYTITGIYEDLSTAYSQPNILVTENDLSTLYEDDIDVDTVYINLESVDVISVALEDLEALGFNVYQEDNSANSVLSYIEIGTKILTGVSAISMVVAAIMIFIVLYISIVERTKEIGILRAIGARKHDISKMFIFEAGFIGFIGGAFGVIFSLAITLFTNTITGISLGTTLISYNIVYYLFGLAMSLIVSILAGIAPAVKAADLDPAVSLRFE